MPPAPIRISDLAQRLPPMPACPPGRRPLLPRNDFGAGLAGPSEDGGLEEFRLFLPNRARNSAFSALSWAFSVRNAATSARSSTTSAARSSNDGSSADTPP
jgi:hypothetical protein